MSEHTRELVTLPIRKLRLDGGTQARAELNAEAIADYAARYSAGETPKEPIVAFYDGTEYWLADGFHRVNAAQLADIKQLEVDVRSGNRDEAVLFAAGANANHGVRRTNADKRRAVEMLLRCEKWATKADNWIARSAGVSPKTVDAVRSTLEIPKSPVRETVDGRRIDTTNIGKKSQAETMAEQMRALKTTEAHEAEEVDEDVPDVEDPSVKPVRVEPVALIAPPARSSMWGSSDCSQAVADFITFCRSYQTSARAKFAAVDPRFTDEFKRRVEPVLLETFEAMRELLPPEGEVSRRFKVISGGKS